MLSIIHIPPQCLKIFNYCRQWTFSSYHVSILFYKCENRRIPDYFKNMFLTQDNTIRLKRIRCAPQRFNKMETNLPNNSNYEIKVKHTNSKYCRFCIRHELPKLIKENYLPGKVLEKINSHSYSGFVHYAQNYIISKYESICCIRNCYITIIMQ